LANADSVTSANGQAYRAKQVVFAELPINGEVGSGVKVMGVVEDSKPGKQVYDPRHPLADAKGYVVMPNVSVIDETVNMIAASRSYQNSVEILNTAKTLLLKTLTLGQ
jgi:flagellar basal-body rod protein FlgC